MATARALPRLRRQSTRGRGLSNLGFRQLSLLRRRQKAKANLQCADEAHNKTENPVCAKYRQFCFMSPLAAAFAAKKKIPNFLDGLTMTNSFMVFFNDVRHVLEANINPFELGEPAKA